MNQRIRWIGLRNPLTVYILLSGAIAITAVGLSLPVPVRSIAVIAFMFFSPGAAFMQLLPVRDRAAQFIFSLALSIVMGTAAALFTLYLDIWSPIWTLAVLYLVSLTGVGMKLRAGFLDPS